MKGKNGIVNEKEIKIRIQERIMKGNVGKNLKGNNRMNPNEVPKTRIIKQRKVQQ